MVNLFDMVPGTRMPRMRLVDKSFVQWAGDNPHDTLTFTSPQTKKHLKGDILHYSFNSFEEHAEQKQ